MGEENTSNSCSNDEANDRSSETQVILNVYDLTPLNHYTVWLGVGIFHSGIEGQHIKNQLFHVFVFSNSCSFFFWSGIHFLCLLEIFYGWHAVELVEPWELESDLIL